MLNNINNVSVTVLGAFTAKVCNNVPITYLLIPWSRVLPEKLTGSAASQEIPRIFGTRWFLTVLTSARHLSISWANSIQSPQPLPTSWRFILILSSHLRLGLPNGNNVPISLAKSICLSVCLSVYLLVRLYTVTLLTPNRFSSNLIIVNSNKIYRNPQNFIFQFATNNRQLYDKVLMFLRISQAQLFQSIIMYQPDIRFKQLL